VTYFKELYSTMRRGIIDHPYYLDESNASELVGMDFVFLCLDARVAKMALVEQLEEHDIAFIDVGMGLELVDDSLRGIVRATASTPDRRDHFRRRVPLANIGVDPAYETNIQVADLNALNATLAVVKWKKIVGFYLDFRREHNITYTVDVNMLLSDDDCDEA
jgi:hypothetical protein